MGVRSERDSLKPPLSTPSQELFVDTIRQGDH